MIDRLFFTVTVDLYMNEARSGFVHRRACTILFDRALVYVTIIIASIIATLPRSSAMLFHATSADKGCATHSLGRRVGSIFNELPGFPIPVIVFDEANSRRSVFCLRLWSDCIRNSLRNRKEHVLN